MPKSFPSAMRVEHFSDMKCLVALLVISPVLLPIPAEASPSPDGFVSIISSLVTHSREMVSQWLNNLAIRADWKETPKAHFIFIDVPGLRKEELKIEVEENGILRVSGQRQIDRRKKKDVWHVMERGSKFSREFVLPSNADLDSVLATLEDGVLTVFLRKLSPDKTKGRKTVNINPTKAGGGDNQRYNLVEL